MIVTSCDSLYKPRFYDQRTYLLNGVSEDRSYGYSSSNPIKTGGGSQGELMYLNALTGPDGEEVEFIRLGSCCPYSDPDLYNGGGMLEKINLKFSGEEKVYTVYIDMYRNDSLFAPVGFHFKGSDLDNPIEYGEAKPLIPIEQCTEEINFAPYDENLEFKLGRELIRPQTPAFYSDGYKELENYFKSHTVEHIAAKGKMFRVHIAFIVNCHGEIGNFIVVNLMSGAIAVSAYEVVKIASDMPRKWKPAIHNNEKVDSWVVMSFNLSGGKFNTVEVK